MLAQGGRRGNLYGRTNARIGTIGILSGGVSRWDELARRYDE